MEYFSILSLKSLNKENLKHLAIELSLKKVHQKHMSNKQHLDNSGNHAVLSPLQKLESTIEPFYSASNSSNNMALGDLQKRMWSKQSLKDQKSKENRNLSTPLYTKPFPNLVGRFQKHPFSQSKISSNIFVLVSTV